MTRSILAASLGATLGLALLGGCATVNMPGGDSGLVEQVRQELATDPMLNTSRVTVTERDGVIVNLGDAMAYPTIFEANKEVIKDPDLIYPGQKIRIPGGTAPA